MYCKTVCYAPPLRALVLADHFDPFIGGGHLGGNGASLEGQSPGKSCSAGHNNTLIIPSLGELDISVGTADPIDAVLVVAAGDGDEGVGRIGAELDASGLQAEPDQVQAAWAGCCMKRQTFNIYIIGLSLFDNSYKSPDFQVRQHKHP